MYESRLAPSGSAHNGEPFADAADMFAQLFGRSPGPRSGTLIAAKQDRVAKFKPAKGIAISPKPPQQRALGKTFFERPGPPQFQDIPERQPTTILFAPGVPQLAYGQQLLGPANRQTPTEYAGNPPFYFVPPGSGAGGGSPPPVAPIPEPSIWAIMLLGFGACGSVLRRRRKIARSETHA